MGTLAVMVAVYAGLFFVGVLLGAYARLLVERARLRTSEGDRLSERSFERLAEKVDADDEARRRRG